jgi:hypothetical protein
MGVAAKSVATSPMTLSATDTDIHPESADA